jgi:FkbM family methyltransferase
MKMIDSGISSNIRQIMKLYLLRNSFFSRLLGKQYFGLNELDKKLVEFVTPKDGYFVELGANDGITQSNTKHFELHKGWRGVLIEPSPNQFKILKKSRSKRSQFYNFACVGFDYPYETVKLLYSNLMTVALQGRNDIQDPKAHAKGGERFSKKEITFEFEVKARTLQSILNEANSPAVVDLLSLDVEGGELEVLSGIDFNRTNFKHILVETRSIEELTTFLQSKNYVLLEKLTYHDYLFKWMTK